MAIIQYESLKVKKKEKKRKHPFSITILQNTHHWNKGSKSPYF
jgi:hypothetical protein